MKILRKAWQFVIWLIEKSDIIPALVIVSGYHYAGALAGRDPLPVAVVLGVLIDLGYYRSVKGFFRKMERQRFIVMLILTAMTWYYHYLWYRDIILSAMLPALIVCLSLISKWDGWERQSARIMQADAQPAVQPALQAAQPLQPALPAHAERRAWRSLTTAERAELKNMHADAVAERYNISIRTAYEWKAKV